MRDMHDLVRLFGQAQVEIIVLTAVVGCTLIAAHSGQQHKKRKHHQRQAQQGENGGIHLVCGRHTAHPHSAIARNRALCVVYIPPPLRARQSAQLAVGKGHRIVELPWHRAIQRDAAGIIDGKVHAVSEIFQVIVNVQPAVIEINLRPGRLYHGGHLPPGVLLRGLIPHIKQKCQRHHGKQHHQQGEPQRNFHLNGKTVLHGSSLST